MATAVENLRITTDFSLRLCGRLRELGVDIGIQQSIACMNAILALKTLDEDELKSIYRITLINRKQDFWRLHTAYEQLLKDYTSPETHDADAKKKNTGSENTVRRRHYAEQSSAAALGEELARTEGYSVREVDHHQDFRSIPRRDIPAAMAELEKIARRHASIARRKFKRSKRRGAIDLRSSVRESVKFDGEILDWRFKRKTPTHSRFVIVSDVSGSMEIYGVFLLNFLYLLNAHRRIKMESFVFSTRLERLTKYFRARNFREMLKNVALNFSAWSGGTKIGAAIEALNEEHGGVVTPKTCVIIMSDGWDTGDAALLDREMAILRSRAKSIVWINPLKGAPAYEPLALGMATARPYCDQFVTGHSVHSLEKFAELVNL